MIYFSTDRFQVRTVEPKEIPWVLELRSECFSRDFVINQYETQADHLVIEDLKTGRMVGAYRLTSSDRAQVFESEEDFELREWLSSPTKKVELAWACTREGYRQGVVIALLWKGLAEYLKRENVHVVFGPASVPCSSQADIHDIMNFLVENNYYLEERKIRARKPEAEDGLFFAFEPFENRAVQKTKKTRRLLPALLRAYLMAGALILLQPVFDPDTNCFDFMTVLDLDQCADHLKNHFDL